MALPKIKSYRKYSSTNYGTHTLKLETGKFSMYFIQDYIAAYHIKDTNKAVISRGFWRSSENASLSCISQEFIDMGITGDDVEVVYRSHIEGKFNAEFPEKKK